MDINMNMNSSSSMMMPMVFQNWNVYQLDLLFEGYTITETWQFALTWFAVAFAAALLHFIECAAISIQQSMIGVLKETYIDVNDMNNQKYDDVRINHRLARPLGWQVLKIIHGVLSAAKYGLSLMLMLVAMTYVPSLFLALVVGYLVGDFTCSDFHMDLEMGALQPYFLKDGIGGSLIRRLLCMPIPSSFITSDNINEVSYLDTSVVVEELENKNHIALDQTKKLPPSRVSRIVNIILWTMPRLTSLVFLVVLLIWIIQVEGAFGFTALTVFGWHALLMSFFVVIFMNEALLTYTAPLIPQLSNNRTYLKYFHFTCHVCSLACIILALIAIVDYKTWSGTGVYPFYVMYSAHSWMGVITLFLWGMQFLAGIWLFAIKKYPKDHKNILLEIHHFTGYVVYAFGLATCASGFMDMQMSDLAPINVAGDDMAMAMSMSMSSMNLQTMQVNKMTMRNTLKYGMNRYNNQQFNQVDNGFHGRMLQSSNATATVLIGGYLPQSIFSHLSSAGAILLMLVGITTFATLKFHSKKPNPEIASN